MKSQSHKPLKIAIVDDQAVARFALRQLIQSRSDWTVVCECESPTDLLATLANVEPDLILVDLCYENESGLGLLTTLKQDYPSVRTLVCSASVETDYADQCFKLGATGYISKQESAENVIEAIECVAKGYLYVSKNLVNYVVDQFSNDDD